MLAVAPAALLVAGCSAGSEESGASGGSRPSAADRARARAARDSRELAARYDAVAAAHPRLAERLRPLRAEVVRHAEAFGAAAESSPSPSPSSSGAGSPPASPPAAVPAKEKDALAGLAAAEREIADRRAKALLDAPGELARLLASVAAAGAAHVYLLTEA
ncbi:lipoprotein [Streptomyces caelestis]|uniref:Lipoprotein n=1 Tax=Streptomyces caelestis TaxID=36816 RepID=A0A0M9X6Y8_9ACTN|nr:lipoprotein [Streptomyces caelestis]KOV23805.1 lipoprotein [Streptomyces sp. XY152]